MANWTENIVFSLGLTDKDRLILVTDLETETIADQIVKDIQPKISVLKKILIEEFVARPAKEFPGTMKKSISEFSPTTSIYCAQGKTGELQSFRRLLIDFLTKELGCRHAHMIGFSQEMILQGMAADYQNLYDLTHRVLEKVKKASVIKVKNSEGTEIIGEFSQSLKWIADDGKIIDPINWHNLPGTEVFTCPVTVNGTIAARVFGDYFSEKFGYLERPSLVEVKDARFVSITTDNQDLKTEFERYMKAEENNDRVGEFAIGTNTGIEKLIGNMLQDEKYPGFHMAFGFPYPEMTGADWNASGHIDLVSIDNDIWADDEQIMAKGKFLI